MSPETLLQLELVAFRVADAEFALEVPEVRGVEGTRALRSAAGGDPVLIGQIEGEGGLIPVVELRRLLGLAAGEAPSGPAPRVLVVGREGEERRLGLLVDGVGGVLTVPAGALSPVPPLLRPALRSWVRAVVHGEHQRLLQLLRLDRLLERGS